MLFRSILGLFHIFVFWVDCFLFLCFRFVYIYSFLINEKVKSLFLNNPLSTSTMITTGFTTLLHILTCWIHFFKLGLRNKGAALANAIFYWINVLLLAIYVRISPSCKKTWTGFSREAMHDVPKFLRLAIPSAVMIWYLQVHFNNKIVVCI